MRQYVLIVWLYRDPVQSKNGQDGLLTGGCAHVRKAADVVDDVGRVPAALPDALPADHGVRPAPLVALGHGLGAAAGGAAGVEDDRDVVVRDVRQARERPRRRGECGDVGEREERERQPAEERGKVRVVHERAPAALGEQVAHDGAAGHGELEAEELGHEARARERVQMHEVRRVLARQPAHAHR